MVTEQAGDAHQLPRGTGSISNNLNFCQAEEHEHTSENGQHLCQCLHKPLYGDSLMANEFISNADMEMVCRVTDFLNNTTPSRGRMQLFDLLLDMCHLLFG